MRWNEVASECKSSDVKWCDTLQSCVVCIYRQVISHAVN